MMMEIISSIIIILAFLWLSGRKVHRCFLLNKYKTVLELFNYFLEKSFEVIYNDQIIGYTSEGQKIIPDDELETIERNFIKLTFEIMGIENEKTFIMFFGDKKTVIDNIVLYARKQLSTDALAKIFQEQQING